MSEFDFDFGSELLDQSKLTFDQRNRCTVIFEKCYQAFVFWSGIKIGQPKLDLINRPLLHNLKKAFRIFQNRQPFLLSGCYTKQSERFRSRVVRTRILRPGKFKRCTLFIQFIKTERRQTLRDVSVPDCPWSSD